MTCTTSSIQRKAFQRLSASRFAGHGRHPRISSSLFDAKKSDHPAEAGDPMAIPFSGWYDSPAIRVSVRVWSRAMMLSRSSRCSQSEVFGAYLRNSMCHRGASRSFRHPPHALSRRTSSKFFHRFSLLTQKKFAPGYLSRIRTLA